MGSNWCASTVSKSPSTSDCSLSTEETEQDRLRSPESLLLSLKAGIIYYVYVDWKRLRILLKCIKQSSLCPVVLADLGNQTVLNLFAMCRLNYNHFQTWRITTESWSRSVWGTGCLRTTPGTHAYRNFSQNGCSKSRFSNFKVVLNTTATTDFFLYISPSAHGFPLL